MMSLMSLSCLPWLLKMSFEHDRHQSSGGTKSLRRTGGMMSCLTWLEGVVPLSFKSFEKELSSVSSDIRHQGLGLSHEIRQWPVSHASNPPEPVANPETDIRCLELFWGCPGSTRDQPRIRTGFGEECQPNGRQMMCAKARIHPTQDRDWRGRLENHETRMSMCTRETKRPKYPHLLRSRQKFLVDGNAVWQCCDYISMDGLYFLWNARGMWPFPPWVSSNLPESSRG